MILDKVKSGKIDAERVTNMIKVDAWNQERQWRLEIKRIQVEVRARRCSRRESWVQMLKFVVINANVCIIVLFVWILRAYAMDITAPSRDPWEFLSYGISFCSRSISSTNHQFCHLIPQPPAYPTHSLTPWGSCPYRISRLCSALDWRFQSTPELW